MSIASSKKINTVGLVLLASVACRPHKALGDQYGYPISRWLGLNTRNRFFGSLICAFLDYSYRNFYGFPKSSKTKEIVWTQERVAYLNWNEFTQQTKEISCPVIFFYAKNDHLLQVERFEELAALISRNMSLTTAPGQNRVIVFEDGGHNIQKTKASEIGKEVNGWILSIFNRPE
jgi:pimeloyl-ACP methyl ester carboxylesterase